MNPKVRAALKARDDLRNAERAYKDAVAEAFPVGSSVNWFTSRNGSKYLQEGEVLENNRYSANVCVRNTRTGITRWMEAHALLDYLEDASR